MVLLTGDFLADSFPAMADKYLILSDLHLADVDDHPDGWMAHKGSKFIFDVDLADLISGFVASAAVGDNCQLILNGDVIDFDLVTAVPEHPPWPVSRSERKRGLDATEAKSVWKLERVLGQHPLMVDTLMRFLAGGHRLIWLMGNHDRELHFPAVRSAIYNALRDAAETLGLSFQESQIQFEPWFYTVPGKIYVEHGQQYDHYTSFRNVLNPTVRRRGREEIALPMGNLSNRMLMSRMGYFNPHASDFILNVFSYAWHWLKHYAFTRRSLALNWFWGSLVVLWRLLMLRRHQLGKARRVDELLPQVAEHYGLSLATVRGLWDLQDPPITGRLFRMIREFWIDRLLIAIVMTGGTIALALVPIPLWIKLMVPLSAFPLFYFVYEWAVQGESIFSIEKKFPKVARRVSELVQVRIVVFGHTHKPRLIPLSKDVTFADTGTWAPISNPARSGILAPGFRNYLVADFPDESETGAAPCVQLRSWQPADFESVPGRGLAEAQEDSQPPIS